MKGALDCDGDDNDVTGINLKILKADEGSNRTKAAPARMALEDVMLHNSYYYDIIMHIRPYTYN